MNMPIAARSAIQGYATQPYVDHVRRDAAFHAFIAVYALVGFAVAIVVGVPHKFAPFTYAILVVMGLGKPLALLVVGFGLWSLRSSTPLQAFRSILAKVLMGPQTVAGLLLFASLLIFIGVFTSLKTMLPDLNPFFADPYLADLDRLLHGRDPWMYAVALLPPRLTPVIEVLYFGVWMLLLMAPMLAVLLVPGLRAVRAQYVWTALIIWPLLGNLIAGAAMSAGPVFYDRIVGDARFGSLMAHVAQYARYQELAQAYLWKSYVSGEAGAGVAISAFPSMHLANATLLVLLASRVHRWLLWAAVVFCGLILFGSVYLGWHYAVDGYFSIAATVLIWKVVGWRLKRKPLVQTARP
jgi:PAP2 superfamily protein